MTDKTKDFTDAKQALDAVLAKREALSAAESDLAQDRLIRIDEKGARPRRVLDPFAPERGVVKADDGPSFVSIGYSSKHAQLVERVREARGAYDEAFARYVEASRARDAEVALELAASQAKSAEAQAEAAKAQARSADKQASSAEAQAGAANAQTEIAKTVRNLTVAIFVAAAVQAVAASVTVFRSCTNPVAEGPAAPGSATATARSETITEGSVGSAPTLSRDASSFFDASPSETANGSHEDDQ